MSRQIPWPRVLAEGLVIVASILLALFGESWWTARIAEAEMSEELGRIGVEIRAERGRITANADAHESRAAAALEIAELLDSDRTSEAVPDSLLATLGFVPTYDNQTPGLDGLLTSGRVSEISDLRVRSGITRWERALNNVSDAELWAREFSRTQLMPALMRSGNVGHITRASGRRWVANPGQEGGLDLLGTTTIRADPELDALLSDRYHSSVLAAFVLRRLLDSADSLVSAIDAR